MPSYDNNNDGKKLIRDTDYCYLSPHFSGNRYWSQSRMLFFKNVIMMLAILASFDIFINFLIHFMTPVEPWSNFVRCLVSSKVAPYYNINIWQLHNLMADQQLLHDNFEVSFSSLQLS